VVSDAKKAARIIDGMRLPVLEREVLLMEMPNKPGELARIAEKLAEAGINLEYAYCTSSGGQDQGNMILRTNDLSATIDALS